MEGERLSIWFGGLSGLFCPSCLSNRTDRIDQTNQIDQLPATRCEIGLDGRAFLSTPAFFLVAFRLQGTQKVENVLLLAILERIEVHDHCVCFGCIEGEEASAAMRLYCLP
jgi:hypothetical protein